MADITPSVKRQKLDEELVKELASETEQMDRDPLSQTTLGDWVAREEQEQAQEQEQVEEEEPQQQQEQEQDLVKEQNESNTVAQEMGATRGMAKSVIAHLVNLKKLQEVNEGKVKTLMEHDDQ